MKKFAIAHFDCSGNLNLEVVWAETDIYALYIYLDKHVSPDTMRELEDASVPEIVKYMREDNQPIKIKEIK